MHLIKKKIILASASPRRSELMRQAGFEFEVQVSEKEERYQSSEPDGIVKELALLKAKDIASQIQPKDIIIIGADTVVALNGMILGKPKSEEDAFAMIQRLQGKEHQVYTGVAILLYDGAGNETVFCEAIRTDVYVNAMTDAEIEDYISNEYVMDKAGAYGIQGRFAIYIEKIVGDYYNVMGLPISYIYNVLKSEMQNKEVVCTRGAFVE